MNPFPTGLGVGEAVALRRENTRSVLALIVIGVLSVLALTIAVFVLVQRGHVQDLMTGVFTPVIGIAGTVLGFYFGSQEGKQ
ncbi:MAG TPA: hypothetical protein VK402_01740 [Blastococcus sp.]|nr:hypothetical protein [Blastococcus sp.]